MVKKILTFGFFITLIIGTAAYAEKITIVGTGSGTSILKAIGEAFTAANPDISIDVPASIGSGGGINAVCKDEYILGRVAREIKENEKILGLTRVALAYMPVVFFVNDTVTVTSITAQQACDIYSGKIRNWEEIGVGKGKIRVIRREDGDSSLSILLKTLPGFKDITLTEQSKTTYSDVSTVEECVDQENAIAFGPWPNVKNIKGVHALEIGGVGPVHNEYPCGGTLSLIYKEKNYKGNVKKFVEFATSPAVYEVMRDAGALPVQ